METKRVLLQAGGSFVQTGGTLETISIGMDPVAEGGSSFTMFGGRLETVVMRIAAQTRDQPGVFSFLSPDAEIVVTDLLLVKETGRILAVPGATIYLAGADFVNRCEDPADLAGLRNMTIICDHSDSPLDSMEVAGREVGPAIEGLEDNFAIGTLKVGSDTRVGRLTLRDSIRNWPGVFDRNALYVENLVIGAGSSLDLSGLNVYYLNGEIDPDATVILNGGEMTRIPEPTSLAFLTLGVLALARRTRRR